MSKKKTNRPAKPPKIPIISDAPPKTSGSGRAEPLSCELCDALRLRDQAIAIFHREESFGLRGGCILMELYPAVFEKALLAAGLSMHTAIKLGVVTDIPCYGLKIFDDGDMVLHIVWSKDDQILLVKFQRGAWEAHIEP